MICSDPVSLSPARHGGSLFFFLYLPAGWASSLKHLHFSPCLLAPPRSLFFLTHVPAWSGVQGFVFCVPLFPSCWYHLPLLASRCPGPISAEAEVGTLKRRWSLRFQFLDGRDTNSSSYHALISFLMPLVFCFILAFAQRMILEPRRRTPLSYSRTPPCQGAGMGRRASLITPTCDL